MKSRKLKSRKNRRKSRRGTRRCYYGGQVSYPDSTVVIADPEGVPRVESGESYAKMLEESSNASA